jgi:glycine betaine/proline transport system substrate-binding protein
MILALVLVLGCDNRGAQDSGSDENSREAETEAAGEAQTGAGGTVTLSSAAWSSAVASANLVKAVLTERLGMTVEIDYLPAGEMWAAVAQGDADATVSAWLPVTHADYEAEYGNSVVDLGPNLEGVRTGLVVPRVSVGRQTDDTGERVKPYIPVHSIPELADYATEFEGRIIGIDPGAGVMQRARDALRVYELANSFRLVAGSEEEMIAALERAIRLQQWIVVTGWTPHWAFGQWELEFLDDPQNVFGSSEEIHTLVSPTLEADHPEVYAFLQRFQWNLDQIGQVMLWIQRDDGVDPYGKALRWMETHPEQVDGWLAAGSD